jgi:hypothetical protein
MVTSVPQLIVVAITQQDVITTIVLTRGYYSQVIIYGVNSNLIITTRVNYSV